MSRSRLRRPPGAFALGLAVLVGAVGSAGVLVAARDRSDDVAVVPGVEEAFSEQDGQTANFLLVGSDSRESIDPADPNAGAIGDADDVVGRRSDTIMILRREQGGGASLLSIPRDLWVPIAGRGESDKINSAYNDGPEVLARTITESLGIPIQHYVEVDFVGFTKLVDAIGGVQICTMVPAQDLNSGLLLAPGCTLLDGSQGLAYARSRKYEEFVDGEWQRDPTGDIGRIDRQQQFIREAVKKLLAQLESDPFSLGDLIGVATSSVRIDANIDPVQAAQALRSAAAAGLETYALPVLGIERDGQSALELDVGAEPILDYFRGTGPQPPPTTTTVPG